VSARNIILKLIICLVILVGPVGTNVLRDGSRRESLQAVGTKYETKHCVNQDEVSCAYAVRLYYKTQRTETSYLGSWRKGKKYSNRLVVVSEHRTGLNRMRMYKSYGKRSQCMLQPFSVRNLVLSRSEPMKF